MRRFTTGGVRFYFLQAGEKVPDVNADRNFVGGYVIWPRNTGKWDVRWNPGGEWKEISDRQFENENEAFNFAHDHHIDLQNKAYSRYFTD